MTDQQAAMERGFAAGLMTGLVDGGVSFPYLFFKFYHKLHISDAEAMLIMHLHAFREKDEKPFPTLEELASRMSSAPQDVIRMLQRLMKEKLVDIEESFDVVSGVQVERYSLTPLLMKLAAAASQEEYLNAADTQQTSGNTPGNVKPRSGSESGLYALSSADGHSLTKAEDEQEENLFFIFEQEFGRPLSPMEIEMINGWLDNDAYPEPLILAALKEAVFAGKVAFRYVDRILLDWHRNKIRTVEEAKEYTQKFRGMR